MFFNHLTNPICVFFTLLLYSYHAVTFFHRHINTYLPNWECSIVSRAIRLANTLVCVHLQEGSILERNALKN